MSTPLLTIIVPTYNRCDAVAVLLRVLQREVVGLDAQVEIIVGDNASTDRTPEVTAEFRRRRPATLVLRHASNVGPDGNFLQCLAQATGRHFWIIGDDDMPRAGLVRPLLQLLVSEEPDLLYINSDWRKAVHDNDPHDPVVELKPVWHERLSFARRLNVWATFISGMIVHRERYLSTYRSAPADKYIGSYLVQLSWVFDTLREGAKLLVIEDRHIIATADNSTGYGPYRVFGANYSKLCNDFFGAGSPITKILVRRTIVFHLPQLIWNTRYSRVPGFNHENLEEAVRAELGGYTVYWLLLEPIARFPIVLSRAFLLLGRVVARGLRLADARRTVTIS
jgi:abequosyltransferase